MKVNPHNKSLNPCPLEPIIQPIRIFCVCFFFSMTGPSFSPWLKNTPTMTVSPKTGVAECLFNRFGNAVPNALKPCQQCCIKKKANYFLKTIPMQMFESPLLGRSPCYPGKRPWARGDLLKQTECAWWFSGSYPRLLLDIFVMSLFSWCWL